MKKQKHKKKNLKDRIIDYAIIAGAVIGFLFLIVYYFPSFISRTKETRADSGGNVSGWAWSSSIGWISFGGTAQDGSSYRVNLVENDFDGDSYAWSSSLGWLHFNFDPATVETPIVSTGDDYNYPARLEENGELRGWARFSSISNGGWIRFYPDPDDEFPDGSLQSGQWGVKLASGPGSCTADGKKKIIGKAWSEEYGWISFNGLADDGAEYGVYLEGSPDMPANINAELSSASSCNTIIISWDYDSCGQTGFEINRKIEGGSWGVINTVDADVRGYTDSGLSPGTKYFYQIRAIGECDNSDWAATGQIETASVCAIGSIGVDGKCPANVIVSWSAPLAELGANLSYAVQRKAIEDENGNPIISDWVNSTQGTCSSSPAPSSCEDIISESNGGKKTYIYKVIATDANTGNSAGTESDPAGVVPCPPAPGWTEVIPR